MYPVINLVGDDAGDYGYYEENGKQHERLLGNHGQHDEGFVSGRGYHHGYEGSEAEHPVGVKGNGRKTSHTAWNRSQKSPDDHLTYLCAAQSLEEKAFGLDVQ